MSTLIDAGTSAMPAADGGGLASDADGSIARVAPDAGAAFDAAGPALDAGDSPLDAAAMLDATLPNDAGAIDPNAMCREPGVVCADDGKNYENECAAHSAGVLVLHHGAC